CPGGEISHERERPEQISTAWLGRQQQKMTLQDFAEGVLRVVNANMEKAIRVVSIERGYDAREFTLVAFGGAGGLHACELAAELGIPRVLVPPLPGALSAYGILASDVVKDYSRTVLWRMGARERQSELKRRWSEDMARLEGDARRDFKSEGWRAHVQFRPSADLRYWGQGYELNVAVHDSKIAEAVEAFHAEHLRRYGYSNAEKDVELVTLRLR